MILQQGKMPRLEADSSAEHHLKPCDYFEEYLQSQPPPLGEDLESEHEDKEWGECIRLVFRPDFTRYTIDCN